VASFYLDGPALSWFQWMFRNNFITSWSALLQAIEARFAPSFYDDPRGTLFKLVQRGSVTNYLTEFERLANRITGLSPSILLSCFISGLNPKIRREVQAFQPISLPQATALARLQENKLLDRKKHTTRASFGPSLPPNPTVPHTPTQLAPRPRAPFIQRTQEEMAFRREKGLCYNCDEKWSSSHRCKGRVFLLIADPDDPATSEPPSTDYPHFPATEPNPTPDETNPVLDPNAPHPHISLHALAGVPASDTFRLYGLINSARVTILVDSSSTHNFVQPRVAKFLSLPVKETTTLRVMVGNGSVLQCHQSCSDTQVLMQGHTITVTLWVLPLSGADIVLEVEWLHTLGPITTDYSSFTMQFVYNDKPVNLHADVHVDNSPASTTQVRRMISTNSTSSLFHISLLPVNQPESTTNPPQPIPAINKASTPIPLHLPHPFRVTSP